MAKRTVARESDPVNCLYELVFPNGKRYWGITGFIPPNKRLFQHAAAARRGGKLPIHRAICKYGVENVVCKTHIIGKRKYTAQLEIAMISAYNTTDFKYGYNISTGGEGTSGPLHSAAIRAIWNDSGYRERQLLSRQIAWNRPGVKDRYSEIRSKLWRNNSYIWITKGGIELRIPKSLSIPVGWSLGRSLSENHLKSIFGNDTQEAAKRRSRNGIETSIGTIWINNGKINMRLKSKDIPEGWERGKLVVNDHGNRISQGLRSKNLIWINNGIKSSRIPAENVVPDGWYLGRLPRKRK